MAKAFDRSTQAIIEAANEWLVRLNDGQVTAADEADFAAWLRESPVHVREYLRAECLWLAMEGIDPARRIDVDALLRDVPDNVTPMFPRAGRGKTSPEIASRRRLGAVSFAGTAAAALLALAGWWYTTLPQADSFVTGLGEQRRLVLEDGSVIDMNTQSELTVVMTSAERTVELLGGEALFTVAKDPLRPFIVHSAHTTVRALGTQFNVYQRPDEVQVTVLQGRVRVASEAPPVSTTNTPSPVSARSVELSAGDAAAVRPGAPIRKTAQVNVARTVAWTERRLIFDNEPLWSVVAEFNRYNSRQLVVPDADLAARRISAVFDADRPDALLRFLAHGANVRVSEQSPSRILIEPANRDSDDPH